MFPDSKVVVLSQNICYKISCIFLLFFVISTSICTGFYRLDVKDGNSMSIQTAVLITISANFLLLTLSCFSITTFFSIRRELVEENHSSLSV